MHGCIVDGMVGEMMTVGMHANMHHHESMHHHVCKYGLTIHTPRTAEATVTCSLVLTLSAALPPLPNSLDDDDDDE